MTPEVLHFYRSSKEARQGVMRLYRAASDAPTVAGIIQPAKLLTDKERARFDKVSKLLDDGKASQVYNVARMKAEGKNLGGSLLEERIVLPAYEKDYVALEAKWAKRDEPSPDVEVDFDLIDPSPAPAKVPLVGDQVRCNFCEVPVERIRATEGKGPLKGHNEVEFVHDLNGRMIGWEEKWKLSQSKVWACPDCVLKLKAVRWPETEG